MADGCWLCSPDPADACVPLCERCKLRRSADIALAAERKAADEARADEEWRKAAEGQARHIEDQRRAAAELRYSRNYAHAQPRRRRSDVLPEGKD